jgi:thiol-disulfide isomerase/thioredoxin
MTRKILLLCALFLGVWLVASVQAAVPTTYREIAMLLRNGEDQQFIMKDTAQRKLLQPISQEQLQDLAALHASPALLALLRDPNTLLSSQAAAAYTAQVEQQKQQALQAQRQDVQAAAQAQIQKLQQIQQQQQQQQAGGGAHPAAPGGAAGAPDPNAALVGRPVTMKFEAADGSVIDTQKLRGKVVLLDFWATWCGPCMKEVPNVVAAYNKYHSKGFEIIGVSLDQDKDAMQRVTTQQGMTWPQYFDGKGWKNNVAVQCNIRSIPAMWLINQNGILVTTSARGNLDAEIGKLLGH